MESRIILVSGVTLVVGLVLGYMFAPNMPGNNTGMMETRNVDAHFIEQMIPHHEGAIAMAQLARERATRPEVKALAQDIITAQTGEIAQMEQWYRDWFGRAPTESMGHGGMQMGGMEGDLDTLRSASDFDREFVRQMIAHHEMAIMMAQMLESGTVRPEMKRLASGIISSQSREIEMMRGWLSSWSQ